MLLFACYSLYQYVTTPTQLKSVTIVDPEYVWNYDCSQTSYTLTTTGHKTQWCDTKIALTITMGEERVSVTGSGYSLFEGKKLPFTLLGYFSMNSKLGVLVKKHTPGMSGWYEVPYTIKYCHTSIQLISDYNIYGELFLSEPYTT